MNTKQHVDKTLVLFCNLQVGKLIEPKNSKNSTENAQVLIVSPIDVFSPLSTTQCPNRLQCCHKPCTADSTFAAIQTLATGAFKIARACHMAQDACSFSEQAAVCTTVPPRVHNDVHLVTRKACHICLAVACNDPKYHRYPQVGTDTSSSKSSMKSS